jgi:mannose-6-phosphate isomerase-like protein (cupin superfamily)
MQYTIQAEETGEPVTSLLTVPEFRQRILRFDGEGDERKDDERDEVLYVLEGTAVTTVGGERQELEPGTGVFVARGTPWQIESADSLKLLSVLVEEPLPATASQAVIAGGERGPATAGREFTLLAHPENGCASVTQFVGYIPPGRAPDHFHRYDEVVYVLAGEGAFHWLEASPAEPPTPGRKATPPSAAGDGESAPLRAGSCVHLPARLVHCLENHGPGEMRVLGVFRPAGSPAEAYYPDGSAAVVAGGC